MTADWLMGNPRAAASLLGDRHDRRSTAPHQFSAPQLSRKRAGPLNGFAWKLCGAGIVVWRLWATLHGRRRDADVVIYKVDRLGDWLLAGPSIERIVADGRARGGTVVLWAADESVLLRRWRESPSKVESFALEPVGAIAKMRRAWKVMRLLATYRVRSFICLRHAPEQIRDFVLRHVDAKEIRALSWVITGGAPGEVPHEILRHRAILKAAGLAPVDPRDLLPVLPGRTATHGGIVVIAPFSSGIIKDWTDESWVKVAQGMASRGFLLELWVGPAQLSRAGALADKIAASGYFPRASVRTGTLGELAAAIAGCAVVLSVDTFAAHLAVAMDVPVVSLVGGGQFGDFGPWQRSARQRWLSNPLPCFGCDWRCTRSRVECMEDISAESMLREADEALQCDVERGAGASRSNRR
jgi:hypothetical protein